MPIDCTCTPQRLHTIYTQSLYISFTTETNESPRTPPKRAPDNKLSTMGPGIANVCKLTS